MRTIAKLAAGAVMACGAAVAVAAPAAAQVSFGIGVGGPPVVAPYPAVPAYNCYDGYGNYVYSYPYCTAYAAPVYGPPVVAPYFGIGIGGGWGYGHRDFDRGHGGYAMRGGDHGGYAMRGGGHGDHHRG